jgi:hypothetical protein
MHLGWFGWTKTITAQKVGLARRPLPDLRRTDVLGMHDSRLFFRPPAL